MTDGRTGLYTDLYEVRMVETYLAERMTAPATFSLFMRAVPERPWYVACGVYRAIEFLHTFRYGDAEIAYLEGIGIGRRTLDWLASFEPVGEMFAVEDGTIVVADEPILEYTAPLPEAQLLETALINIVHLNTLAATKAARVALAAGDRPVVDFGFRRAHGLETGIDVALAAYLGGGVTTSNLEAGRRYGIGVMGTMAHSLVQAFPDETDAFRAFARDHPDNVVLLVDTYDTLEGVRRAIAVADELKARGSRLAAIRLDSGDLSELARRSRELLDEAGHPEVTIFASGGLDEHDVARLAAEAPIDAFGVGSHLAASSDRPVLDIVYKLVAYDGRPVAKLSEAKATLPGAKQVFRSGGPQDDVLGMRDEDVEGARLLSTAWSDGTSRRSFDIAQIRERVDEQIALLPREWKTPEPFDDPPHPRLSDALQRQADVFRSSHPTS